MRRRWQAASRHPVFILTALVVGIGLMFGAPILAQHDDGPEDGSRGSVTAPAHGADEPHESGEAHGTEDHAEEMQAAGTHGEGEHAGEEHHEEGAVHPPTLVTILADLVEGRSLHAPEDATSPVSRFLLTYKAPIYSLLVIVILSSLCIAGARSMKMIPGRFQNVVEWAIEGLDGFIRGILGPEGRRFVPFLGTLFLYIYFQNIFGLFPLMFTPTSMIESTAALGILVFLYVQFVAIRSNGVIGYLKHLAGDPKDAAGWGMAPLMLPLHIVGELAKPLSLSLRLFGNMMGEETLLAVFMGLGVAVLAFTQLPVGIPLHVPFMFLALLTTLIQALVFTILSTIYFSLVLPHPEEEGH
jgi:F-type H+-transporting ATPase subunit a